MSRGRISLNRILVLLGAAVLVLAGVSLFALTQGARFGPKQPTPAERALTQVKAQMGPTAEVRYLEDGKRRAVCGYAGLAGQRQAVEFVSRHNRILMSNDPLRAEFAELKTRFCPGFNGRAPAAMPADAPVSAQG